MTAGGRTPDWPDGRTRALHAWWAGFAIVASLIAHLLLVVRLPELPIGGMRAIQDAIRLPSLQLQDVRTKPPEPREERFQFQPDDPAFMEELLAQHVAPEADVFPDDVSPWDADGGDVPEAVAPPGPVPVASEWQAQQEVLSIQERIFDDEVSALPRRFAENIPRVDVAPDISLPRELPATPPAASPPSDQLPVWLPASLALTSGGGGRAEDVATKDLLDAIELDVEQYLDEVIVDADAPTPVEDVLTVDVATYRSVEERAIYFELRIRRIGEAELPVLPRDVLLIQDSSGSMTPGKLAICRLGLRAWLETLSPRDRVEIIEFSEAPTFCFGRFEIANAENKAKALRFIDGMRAKGHTDMYLALQAALTLPRDPRRPMIVALVSDAVPTAGVTGSPEIIDRFTRENQGRISIFGIGAGKRVNRFLLDLLSYRNRGEAIMMPDDDDIDRAMEQWAYQLRRPVLTDLRYRFSGVDDRDIYPKSLTHLYVDRPLVIYGRLPETTEKAAFQIVGASGENLHDMIFEVDWSEAKPGTAVFRETWARQKLYEMIGDHIHNPSEASMQTIRAFSAEHGILMPFGFSDIVPR